MRILYSIPALLLLAGCGSFQNPSKEEQARQERERQREWSDKFGRSLTYFRDPRTDLCFAYSYGYQEHSITNVPCVNVDTILANPR